MIPADIIRAEFPGLVGKTYLNAGALSIAPQRAVRAMERMVQIASGLANTGGGEIWGEFDSMMRIARRNAAWLINAEESEIALAESTTRGLSIAADAIPLRAGDHVLLADIEYPAVALPWAQKQKTAGLEVEVVPNHNGEVRVEDFAERITPRTKIITVSSTQWTSGYRCDLSAFGALCREHEIFLVIDAIQQLGAIPIDVKATPADFIACGGHKWLNAPFGMGFVYVNRDTMHRLNPLTAGLMGTVPPNIGWGPYLESPEARALRDYELLNEARHFEVGGTTNFGGAGALGASLSLTKELGKDAIAEHVYQFTGALIEGLKRSGIRVVSDFDRQHRAGIVTFDLGSVQKNQDVARELERQGITVSLRYIARVGGVRVCCHFYNSQKDVDRLLEITSRFQS